MLTSNTVAEKMNDFNEFAYSCSPAISGLGALSFENGSFATMLDEPESYEPVEGDVF